MHHFVHYGAAVTRVGSAVWTSMSCFERNNKRMKGMVRQNEHPEDALANDTHADMTDRLCNLDDLLASLVPLPAIRVGSPITGRLCGLYKRQRYCLSLLGAKNLDRPVSGYNVVWIRGVHFRCGEWGKRKCGSVFTVVYCGESMYGILDRVIVVDGVEYAAVTWLSKPVYPNAPYTLVVRVRLPPVQPVHRCVIRCDTIEPCGVNVMPDEDGIHFFMLRTRGFDRRQ